MEDIGQELQQRQQELLVLQRQQQELEFVAQQLHLRYLQLLRAQRQPVRHYRLQPRFFATRLRPEKEFQYRLYR